MSDYVGEITFRTPEECERDSAAEAASLIAKAQAGQVRKVGTGLSEPRTDNVDTGNFHGDPEHRERLRAVEIMGAHGTGTVLIKVKGDDGRMGKKPVEVPATVENLKEAVRQAKLGKPSLPASVAAKARKVEELTHWLKAAQAAAVRGVWGSEAPQVRPEDSGSQRARRTAQAVARDVRVVQTAAVSAGVAKGGRDAGSVDGVALVRGRSMAPVEPPRVNARGGATNAAGWSGPLGRERADRAAVDGAAHASEHVTVHVEGDAACLALECVHMGCIRRECVHLYGESKEARRGAFTWNGAFPFGMTFRDYGTLSKGQQKKCREWDAKQRGRERRAAVAARVAAQHEARRVVHERRMAEATSVNLYGPLADEAEAAERSAREVRALMAAPGARESVEHGSLGAARQH